VGITLQPVLNLAGSHGELRLQSVDPAIQPSLDFGFLARSVRTAAGCVTPLRLCVEIARQPAFGSILASGSRQ